LQLGDLLRLGLGLGLGLGPARPGGVGDAADGRRAEQPRTTAPGGHDHSPPEHLGPPTSVLSPPGSRAAAWRLPVTGRWAVPAPVRTPPRVARCAASDPGGAPGGPVSQRRALPRSRRPPALRGPV